MRTKNKLKLAALAGVVLLSSFSTSAKAEEEVMATVNGDNIYKSEFEKNWNAYMIQKRGFIDPSIMTPEWEQTNKRIALDDLIGNHLLLQEAKKRRIGSVDNLINAELKVKPATDDEIRALFEKVKARMSDPAPLVRDGSFQADIGSMAQYYKNTGKELRFDDAKNDLKEYLYRVAKRNARREFVDALKKQALIAIREKETY